MKNKIYKLNRELFNALQPSAIKILEDEFDITGSKNKYIKLNYTDKNYTCNDKLNKVVNSDIQAISFFSGAGGLDIGAQLAGVKVISSLDFEKQAVETLKANKYFSHTEHICDDISNRNAEDYSKVIQKNNPDKLILIGGPPCQPFSKAGYWVTNKNRNSAEDPRNMIGQYLRIIDEIRPDGFVLENVESILHPTNIDAVRKIEDAVSKMGYNLLQLKLNAADYGIPQKRKRVFFLASKNKFDTAMIPTHGNPKDILKDNKLLSHENVLDWIGIYDKDKYFEPLEVSEGKYYDDLCSVIPGKNYISLTNKFDYPNPKFIAGKRYWSFLLKLHPHLPSWTLIAKPGHWEGPFHWNNRRLRTIEAAALQTFPSDYIFTGSPRSIRQQIGNAVPPLLGQQVIAHLIKNLL